MSRFGSLMTSLFQLLFLLVLKHLPPLAEGIVCYQCDSTQDTHGNCPGWYRRPVDTLKDLHDRVGLYTHCIEIRLANGTIIHQGPVPEYPTCTRDFRMTWKLTLERRFKHRLWVRCCDYDLCNAARPLQPTSSLGTFVRYVSVISVTHLTVSRAITTWWDISLT